MTAQYTHRYVIRAVIEFTTPFLIGAGKKGDIADAVFAADANGLPALPGSSIAGVLRARFRENFPESDEKKLFGFQKKDEGEGSRLSVSWGCIHDSRNVPVEGIVSCERLDDPVLAKALSPVIRDHVRINHKGASDAEEHGKFDEQAVCAGQRFTFELELTGSENEKDLWGKLMGILSSSSLRFGGKTRRGFGAFRFVSIHSRIFDLRSDFSDYASHPVSLAEKAPSLTPLPLPQSSTEKSIRLMLQPRGYWMFGGGYDLPEQEGNADMAPVRDCRIIWENGMGSVEEDLLVIPASSVKGALAHRTAFHYNALKGIFADEVPSEEIADHWGEGNKAVRELFGYCKNGSGKDDVKGEKDTGRPGKVFMDDIYLPGKVESQLVHHVGIDRFTGGARDQVLFSERPLWKGASLPIHISISKIDSIEDRSDVLKAFRSAVNDLAEGRLQIGGGSGRGLGYFDSDSAVEWPGKITAAMEEGAK